MPIKYHFYFEEKISIPILDSIGFSADIDVTHYGPAKRNLYLIHYVLSGKGYFNGNPVERGQGFLITPGLDEHYYADTKDPWSYLWVISSDPNMKRFFDMHNADKNAGIFQFHNVTVIENIAKELTMAPAGIHFGKHFSALQLTEYFLHIYNNCIYSPENRSVSNAKLYFDFTVNYINSFLHLPISVNEICKKLGVSQPYLYSIFKNECGLSPKAYISKKKLDTAKKLLAETDYLISEISASVGFSDALAFSKFFSLEEKISPSEYRRRNRG